MSQDLLYSILARPMSNQVSSTKEGIKKVDKIAKKGVVQEEETTLTDEKTTLTISKKSDNAPSTTKDDGTLDTYA